MRAPDRIALAAQPAYRMGYAAPQGPAREP
jgi:hypothetical protein